MKLIGSSEHLQIWDAWWFQPEGTIFTMPRRLVLAFPRDDEASLNFKPMLSALVVERRHDEMRETYHELDRLEVARSSPEDYVSQEILIGEFLDFLHERDIFSGRPDPENYDPAGLLVTKD